MHGFDVSVKTDVLGIWACKSEATNADIMMQKLLPPWPEGEYYVSFHGLDEETKRKAYKHQNWYADPSLGFQQYRPRIWDWASTEMVFSRIYAPANLLAPKQYLSMSKMGVSKRREPRFWSYHNIPLWRSKCMKSFVIW
jgi:hypothetical protein